MPLEEEPNKEVSPTSMVLPTSSLPIFPKKYKQQRRGNLRLVSISHEKQEPMGLFLEPRFFQFHSHERSARNDFNIYMDEQSKERFHTTKFLEAKYPWLRKD